MDLGCIDMGCVDKENVEKEFSDASATRLGKKNGAKEALRSSLTALNRLTSQIAKPPHRKTSPINWFPRKKVEPYLNRKIKMLQEVDGMRSTLDETLGDSNPHYSRVLREKIAIREAAKKATEAGKAAMVEASWCRILQAARIECKEAEARRMKAEDDATEAFDAARMVGVIMNDKPEASAKGGGSMAHTISANFETEFEVDKQVAAAVKAAFVKLASCSSTSKDEFKEILRKISENPDNYENSNCRLTSECDSGGEEDSNLNSDKKTMRKTRKRQDLDKFCMDYMIEMMLGRLQCLKDDELASLATIVATSGLNAALSEMGTAKKDALEDTENQSWSKAGGKTVTARRNTIVAAGTELPSLDKFLVKRLTRLEREVLEPKRQEDDESRNGGNKRKLDITDGNLNKSPRIMEAQQLKEDGTNVPGRVRCGKQDVSELPSLDKFLVKHLTRLEREVLEPKNRKIPSSSNVTDSESKEKHDEIGDYRKKGEPKGGADYESLDKVLVKHVSRLEKEKQAAAIHGEWKLNEKDAHKQGKNNEGSLDQILVKHKSRLEKEKMAAAEQQDDERSAPTQRFASRKQVREKELQAVWGGVSLGNSMRRHVSRLERDKAAWLEAEEEEKQRALEQE